MSWPVRGCRRDDHHQLTLFLEKEVGWGSVSTQELCYTELDRHTFSHSLGLGDRDRTVHYTSDLLSRLFHSRSVVG
jgi:hypothetical protein